MNMFQQLNQKDEKKTPKHDIDKILIFSEMCITLQSIGEMQKVALGPTLLSLVALPQWWKICHHDSLGVKVIS